MSTSIIAQTPDIHVRDYRTTASDGTISIQLREENTRMAAIFIISQNGKNSSIYSVLTDYNGNLTSQKIAGADVSITKTGNTINVPLASWSHITAFSNAVLT